MRVLCVLILYFLFLSYENIIKTIYCFFGAKETMPLRSTFLKGNHWKIFLRWKIFGSNNLVLISL